MHGGADDRPPESWAAPDARRRSPQHQRVQLAMRNAGTRRTTPAPACAVQVARASSRDQFAFRSKTAGRVFEVDFDADHHRWHGRPVLPMAIDVATPTKLRNPSLSACTISRLPATVHSKTRGTAWDTSGSAIVSTSSLVAHRRSWTPQAPPPRGARSSDEMPSIGSRRVRRAGSSVRPPHAGQLTLRLSSGPRSHTAHLLSVAAGYLEPWFAVNDPRLADELRRELPAGRTLAGHTLAGLTVAARARRQDRDDVLFEILDGSGRLARVHLTHQAESDPRWPLPTLFSTMTEWAASMAADHDDYQN